MAKRTSRQKRPGVPSRATIKAAMREGIRLARAARLLQDRALRERNAAINRASPRAIARASARVPSPAALRAAGAFSALGVLLAEGDSWFHYPGTDIIDSLRRKHGYDVEHVARAGDTVESMTYTVRQRRDFVEALDRLVRSGREPRAILLSGGGNDIAGDEFHMLLEHARSPAPGLNADVVRGIIHVRIQNAYLTLLAAITDDCLARLGHTVPILVHGYDYPIPDGRGFCFGPFPGPWLKPGFDRKGYPDRPIDPKRNMMKALIDEFNRMIAGLARTSGLAHVRYVNLRDTLPNASWWANELHPTRAGFEAVAARFAKALETA